MYIAKKGLEMTPELLLSYIDQHRKGVQRFLDLKDYYIGKHPILSAKARESYKPDNRIVVNHCKASTDTFEGFFMGIPVKESHPDEVVQDFLKTFNRVNNSEKKFAKLSKNCSLYGHNFEFLYVDGVGNIRMAVLPPSEAFLILDDSSESEPMFGVRYFENSEGILEGSYSDIDTIYYFKDNKGTLEIGETIPHIFGGVPMIPYLQNEEELGLFEGGISLQNADNKGLSEKANILEYTSNAYLLIMGTKLDQSTLSTLHESGVLNLYDESPVYEDEDGNPVDIGDLDIVADSAVKNLDVRYLAKPDNDGIQENFLNRVEKSFYQTCMVMNINDENFGTQSGISLKYKLSAMENLCRTKEIEFKDSLYRRYRLIANTGLTPITVDNWQNIEFKFTRNYPANILEEAEIAKTLSEITSKETALTVLSVVGNVQDEMGKIKEEGSN